MKNALFISIFFLLPVVAFGAALPPTSTPPPPTTASGQVTISPSTSQLSLVKSFFNNANYANLDQIQNSQPQLTVATGGDHD